MTGSDHHTGTSTNYKSLTALLLCLQVEEPLVSKNLGVLLLFNHYGYIRAKNLQVVFYAQSTIRLYQGEEPSGCGTMYMVK